MNRRQWAVAGIVLFVLLVIVLVALYLLTAPQQDPKVTDTPVGSKPVTVFETAVAQRVLGDPDAPVTIIEYSSLTCPHCAAFHADTLPTLKERYIDTGQAKLVYRDFPLDQYALNAAVIAHCAGEDRYFAFLEAMFASQERWARSANPTESLLQLAALGGMPREQAEACLADEAMVDAVLTKRLDGQEEFAIASTPSFIINGEMVSGNQSVDEFATVIEAALP